jgi:hypothetical protein
MNNAKKRLIVWTAVIAVVLLIPFLLMQFHVKIYDPGNGYEELGWNLLDFVLLGVVLIGIALLYELVARRSQQPAYRAAFGLGLLGALLLFWVNGAVGIIGGENHPANLMYGVVFAIGLIGSIISQFKPRGMSYTLLTAAIVQLLIPIIALLIWPTEASWGDFGVFKILIINVLFAALFAGSALLFHRARIQKT